MVSQLPTENQFIGPESSNCGKTENDTLESKDSVYHNNFPTDSENSLKMESKLVDARNTSSNTDIPDIKLSQNKSRVISSGQNEFLMNDNSTNEENENTTAIKSAVVPLNINAYVYIFLMFLYVCCVGPQFFNWSAWESILLKSEVYNDLCTTTASCDAKKEAIANFYFVFSTLMFLFSLFAGVLCDVLGPKTSTVVGNLILILSWLSFALGVPKPALMYLCFCGVGIATDLSFYGVLSTFNLFPNNKSTIMGIYGAARSLCNGWPLIIGFMMPDTFDQNISFVGWIFTGMYALTLIFILIFLPNTKFYSSEELLKRNNESNLSNMEENKIPRKLTCLQMMKKTCGEQIIGLRTYLLTPIYLTIICVSCLNIIRNNYYLTSAPLRLTETALKTLNIINFLAFLPGPFCGFIIDKFSMGFLLHFINSFATVSFVCLLVGGIIASSSVYNVLSQISVYCLYPFISFLLSQVFCYIVNNYPIEHHGKLMGFANCVAGFVGISAKWMISVNYPITQKSFITSDIVATVMSFIAIPLIEYLRHKYIKREK